MKRILISGYYGFGNLGDEMILEAMVSDMRGLMPDIELIVLSGSPEETAHRYSVRSLRYDDYIGIFSALRGADLFISGGGGLIQDITSQRSLLYYLGLIGLAELLRVPVMVYAQGIGPVNSALGRAAVKKALNRVSLISLRDSESKADLERMGVTEPSKVVVSDPALGLDGFRGRIKDKSGMSVGIAIREWKGAFEYKKVVALLCDKLIDEKRAEIFFVPFHQPRDTAASQDVMRMMHNKRATLCEWKDRGDITSIFSQLDLLIGMRLHALILAALNGVPVVGISYDPKVDRFVESIGQKIAGEAQTLRVNQLEEAVREVYDNRDMFAGRIESRLPELIEMAHRPAYYVRDLLGQ
jgi:polysaccharide pyruvyl transferase CsaB